MNDKSPVKIICRIINLLIYILVTFLLAFFTYTELYTEIDFINKIYETPFKALLICAIPLIIMMIVAIIIKYSSSGENNVNTYRIFETLVRIVCTIPISITIAYYVLKYTHFEILIDTLLAIAIFYIINGIIKFTLQETLNVSFIIHDEL